MQLQSDLSLSDKLSLGDSSIKQTLMFLQNARSETRGTTLITYIVPGDIDSWLVTKHLLSELATASNIKSKQTRNAVIDALKSLQNSIDSFCNKNKTPQNGLVMLSGIVSNDSADKLYYI